MSWVDRHIRPNIRELEPYSSARDEGAGLEGLTFLDANEAPDDTGFNRYPDPYQKALRQALADRLGLPKERLMLGNGSDELIDLLIRACCRPASDHILITPPTYGVYSVMAAINEVGVKEVPLLPETFEPDLEGMLERIRKEAPRIIFLCSPNNPTGNRFPKETVRRLLELHDGPLVVDEAYVDFAEGPSLIPLQEEYEQLVLLRTFSKAWGAASLRAGYAIADPRLIEVLDRIKPPYNVNGVTQGKALELLEQEEAVQERVERIRTEREKLAEAFQGMDAVEKVFPSEANFLLVRFKDPDAVLEQTRDAGLLIRDRRKLPLCEGCLRITVGDATSNDRLLNAIAGKA
jgi:histidinol-phosphate aminotransferase